MKFNRAELWVIRDALYQRAKETPLVEDRQIAAAICKKVVDELQRHYKRKIVDPFEWDKKLLENQQMPADFLNTPPRNKGLASLVKKWLKAKFRTAA